jgi:hypothetical protein
MKSLLVLMVVLICVAIIGFLSITAYGPVSCVNGRAKDTKATLGLFKTALANYKWDIGSYPEKLDYIWDRPPNTDIDKWQGPYVYNNEAMTDGWGRNFRYELFDKGQKCKITSAGKDGKFGTDDDLSEFYTN